MKRMLAPAICRSFQMVVMMATALLPALAWGQAVIPGSGQQVTQVGDNFEDPAWAWRANLPKVSNDKDEMLSRNLPLGVSENNRWFEGSKRGQPDFVQRVETPPGGLPGSQGALALRSLRTGSSRPGYQQQQDDFIANLAQVVGKIPVSQTPNVVTRVWLPPIDQWENRTGCHFAFRLALETSPHRTEEPDGAYWPGMFINMNSKEGKGATGRQHDVVYIWMKATSDGRVIRGPQITITGWWTLGMSVTPDGQVHYYARPGVEDLTEEDRIASSYPFGFRAERMRAFFFNVCNGDDGRTWSTEFVIDDPQLFVIPRSQAYRGRSRR